MELRFRTTTSVIVGDLTAPTGERRQDETSMNVRNAHNEWTQLLPEELQHGPADHDDLWHTP